MTCTLDISFLEGQDFQNSLRVLCCFFQIEQIHEEQLQCIKAFYSGKDVYLSTMTGYGKSFVYQSLPLLHDLLIEQAVGTSIAIVICPLVSLMIDQVSYIQSLGLSAAAIYSGQDPKILADIEEGIYSYVYVSPESLLSVERWRIMLSYPTFKGHCITVCIDEAHCISHWYVHSFKPSVNMTLFEQ